MAELCEKKKEKRIIVLCNAAYKFNVKCIAFPLLRYLIATRIKGNEKKTAENNDSPLEASWC